MKNIIFIFLLALGLFAACTSSSIDNSLGQLTKDTTTISSYLKTNNIVATKLSPGVWFIIDSLATGQRSNFSDTAFLIYKMKLIPDGTVVDQSNTPVSFPLASLVQGLKIGLPEFPKGSKGRIFIPSSYGYGGAAYQSIPANSNLIFDFKLTQVIDKQFEKDTALVNSFLNSNDLASASFDAGGSGLRYVIDTIGTGKTPNLTDSVLISYKEKIIPSQQLIDQTTYPIRVLLSDLFLGLQIGLPHIKEGGTITLYIPSNLAFGYFPVSGVQYANLIYQVKLIKVYSH